MTAGLAYAEANLSSPEELVRQHAPLVRRIALHLATRLPAEVDIDDLIQSGMLGLLEAVQNFDGSRGAAFSSFAGHRIRGAMLDELRRGDWAPRRVHRQARALYQARDDLAQSLGRAPSLAELAAAMQLSIAECQSALDDAARCRLLSLEQTHPGDDDPVVAGIAGSAAQTPHYRHERDAVLQQLSRAIQGLAERDQLVLSLYYRDELHQKEIGHVLGVTESRVSQLHARALKALRTALEGKEG